MARRWMTEEEWRKAASGEDPRPPSAGRATARRPGRCRRCPRCATSAATPACPAAGRWLARLCDEAYGLPRHLSQHSGGMIVSTRPLIDCCPVLPAAMEGRQLCSGTRTPAPTRAS